MRILLLGAGGFIGRHILSDLLGNGHDVIAVVRRSAGVREAYPAVRFVERDLVHATEPSCWTAIVPGVDAIVNAAGVLGGRGMREVHVDMPRALYAAATAAGVKRCILLSAISARGDVPTDYAAAKLEGERIVRDSGLDATILRPSLVYGEGSYGGTSLMRGMAALPFAVPIPGKGAFAFTPIHVGDVARAVRRVCEDDRFAGSTLAPVGPDTLTLREVLARYRRWLGFGPARFVSVPMPVMRLLGRLGDASGGGPVSTNSLVQMIAGNEGDGAAFEAAIGFRPRALDVSLADHPAQVQDRWHARLFFLAPAVRVTLAVLWLASAWLGLAYGAAATMALVDALGLPETWATPLRIGSSLLDIAAAALVIGDGPARRATPAQLALVLGYTLAIGVALPGLWLDPLGPLLKNVPILALILVHGAIADKR